MRIGCEFKVAVLHVLPTFEDPTNPNGARLRHLKDRKTVEQKKCYISKSSIYCHSAGCEPSYEQCYMQKKAAGTLLQKESDMMDHLLQVMEISDKHLDNDHLRAELKLT